MLCFWEKLYSSIDPAWTCSCDECLSASFHLPLNPLILWQLRRWSSQEDGQSRMATTGHRGLFMTHHTPLINHAGKMSTAGHLIPSVTLALFCHNISSIYKHPASTHSVDSFFRNPLVAYIVKQCEEHAYFSRTPDVLITDQNTNVKLRIFLFEMPFTQCFKNSYFRLYIWHWIAFQPQNRSLFKCVPSLL